MTERLEDVSVAQSKRVIAFLDSVNNMDIKDKIHFVKCTEEMTKNVINNMFVSNLEEVNIPEGLEQIGWSAFYRCHKIKTIVVPSSVTFIGGGAFNNMGRIN